MIDILDLKAGIIILLVIILAVGYAFMLRERKRIYQKQEEELQMYQMYVKPLEEFIREIRAKQHEFDNHLNAILNMHVTIDNYEELVATQHRYIHELATSRDNSYLGLLKISNKVLAGFIYSKLKSVKKDVQIELYVGNKEVFTNAPEKDVIEVVGTLIDNAFEACHEDYTHVKLYITSERDRLIFVIKNEHERVPISELSQYFERGFSTKSNLGKRGLGLYNAKRIIQEWNGEIFVENEEMNDRNYLSFRVEL